MASLVVESISVDEIHSCAITCMSLHFNLLFRTGIISAETAFVEWELWKIISNPFCYCFEKSMFQSEFLLNQYGLGKSLVCLGFVSTPRRVAQEWAKNPVECTYYTFLVFNPFASDFCFWVRIFKKSTCNLFHRNCSVPRRGCSAWLQFFSIPSNNFPSLEHLVV